MPEEKGDTGDIVVCPTCQKIWPKETKFCTQCGTWIQSGKVLEHPAGQSSPAASPSRPSIGSSPPGIAPVRPSIGPSPPGIAPTAPPAAEGPAPTTTPDQPEAPQEGEPPKKKYAFKIEPPREERIPQGPAFIPVRTPKKKARTKPSHVILIVICLLAIAYGVISIVSKPLKGYIHASFFQLIRKEAAAVKAYKGVENRAPGSPWAKRATNALNRITKRVLGKHLDLQYYKNWTATSTIVLNTSGQETQLSSTIAYKAPGFVSETVTRQGSPHGRRLINETAYLQSIGYSRAVLRVERYAQAMEERIGFGPNTLFKESGKDKVINVFLDELQLRLKEVAKDENGGIAYVFSIPLSDETERLRKLAVFSGPFIAWANALSVSEVSEAKYFIRPKDGFLLKIEYLKPDGSTFVVQTFADFKADADVSDSTFQP